MRLIRPPNPAAGHGLAGSPGRSVDGARVSRATVVGEPAARQTGDRLKQLRAFCYAASLGSISRAAERVMASQPALSYQIRALEDELGVPLFERHGPRIALTRLGRSLFRYALPLVHDMDRLPAAFAEEQFGVISNALTIGAGQTSAAYLLPRYLKRFRERYPEIRINVKTGVGSQRLRWLRAYEVDLTLLAVDKPPRDLEFHELVVSPFVLITPLDHPLAGRKLCNFADIEGHRLIGHVSGQHGRLIGDSLMRQLGVEPDASVEIDSWSVIKLYVAAGLGISVVPDICVVPGDRVWSTPLDRFLPQRRYGAVTRNDPLLPLAARRFLEVISEMSRDESNPTGAAGER